MYMLNRLSHPTVHTYTKSSMLFTMNINRVRGGLSDRVLGSIPNTPLFTSNFNVENFHLSKEMKTKTANPLSTRVTFGASYLDPACWHTEDNMAGQSL